MSRLEKCEYIAKALQMDCALAFIVRTTWHDYEVDMTYRMVKHDVEIGKLTMN